MGKLVPCDGQRRRRVRRAVHPRLRQARVSPSADRRREAARYLELHKLGSADGGFAGGVELVLTAMLQAPNFLYRAEIGHEDPAGRSALDAYEVATALAYTLTASTPDAMLLAAADAGALRTPQQIEAQAKRLIDTRAASNSSSTSCARGSTSNGWRRCRRTRRFSRVQRRHPRAMAKEVDHFVSNVVFEGDGTLRSLLDTPRFSSTTRSRSSTASRCRAHSTPTASARSTRPIRSGAACSRSAR